MRSAVHFFLLLSLYAVVIAAGSGCANIIPPAGGPKDSLPPRLINATPPDSAKNVRPARITLTFDEYIAQLQNTETIIISPTLSSIPSIESRMKTVTVRLKDTLEPNTTYSINFGNTIKDVNEGNILPDFTYVFSTGDSIDDNRITGRVVMAETGKIDSTLIVVLHQDLSDSAITKLRPRYYTRLNSDGLFSFEHLPARSYNLYVVPKESYTKQYDSTRAFAFSSATVQASDDPKPVTLYAYVQDPVKPRATTPPSSGKTGDKRLRYALTEAGRKDILSPFEILFVRKVTRVDSSRILLTDTNYRALTGYHFSLDSTGQRLAVSYNWQLNGAYKMIIPKDAVADAEGVTLSKTDTISIVAKRAEEYGSIKLRFTNLDLSRNPVLLLVQSDKIVETVRLTSNEWRKSLFKPGEYEIRILYDTNKNGIWDPGNFRLKKQPETVENIRKKLNVKPNWDNETEITL